jgi:hypothetical protein
MTSQNPTEKDPKSVTTPPSDAAPKDAEPSGIKRELTDEEVAAVAGGFTIAGGGSPVPPAPVPGGGGSLPPRHI